MSIVKINNVSDNDKEILNAARNTVNKEDSKLTPTKQWLRRAYFSEHSPIRKKTVDWTWKKIKSWISVHFVRHSIGISHFVTTQRSDRTQNINRDLSPQSTPVNHNVIANAQSIISISRKRLCKQAHIETQNEWKAFLQELKDHEPELVSVCVPECVYRNGLCPEFKTCGYNKTAEFKTKLAIYISGFEEQISK